MHSSVSQRSSVISRANCAALHRRYFDDVTAVAWANGILATDETSQLVAVGKLLSIPAESIAAAMQRPADGAGPALREYSRSFRLERGDLVVLTGEMTRSRDDWQDLHRPNRVKSR